MFIYFNFFQKHGCHQFHRFHRWRFYPFRTQTKGNTLEGYSDHFPVYSILGEKKD